MLLPTLVTLLISLAFIEGRMLQCYDCAGDTQCDQRISVGHSGQCQSLSGRCFIRRDPNGKVYRGCANHDIWPSKLDLSYTGCRMQKYGEWSNKMVLWCFCTNPLCNLAIGQGQNIIVSSSAKALPMVPRMITFTDTTYETNAFNFAADKSRSSVQSSPPVSAKRQTWYIPAYRKKQESGSAKQSAKQNTIRVQRPKTPTYRRPQKTRYQRPARPVRPAPRPVPRPAPRPAPQRRYVYRAPRLNQPRYQPPRPSRPEFHDREPEYPSLPFPEFNKSPLEGREGAFPSIILMDDVSKPTTPRPNVVFKDVSADRPQNPPFAGARNYPNPKQNSAYPPYYPTNTPNNNNNKKPSMWNNPGIFIGKFPSPKYDIGKLGGLNWPYNDNKDNSNPNDAFVPENPTLVDDYPDSSKVDPAEVSANDARKATPQPAEVPPVMADDFPPKRPQPTPVPRTTPRPPAPPRVTPAPPRQLNGLVGVEGKEAQFPGMVDDFWKNVPELKEPVDDLVSYEDCRRANCEHECDVEGGRPQCRCREGYMLAADGKRCIDVDECVTNNGACSNDCQNSIGSFRCLCPKGYTLDADQRTCLDYNECKYLNGVNCDHFCVNEENGYKCACRDGYELDPDQKTCNDINECVLGLDECEQDCENTNGGYKCRCKHGLYLDGDGRSCLDVNECLNENGNCSQTCTNVAGSFDCGCRDGYTLNIDGFTCDDLDECEQNNGGCDQACKNSKGSFSCLCNVGFMLDSDLKSCLDVNECRLNNGGCDHDCDNVPGSFNCVCKNGYSLNVDKKTCDSEDACTIDNGGCDHICSSTDRGARCSCRRGFMLNTDGKSCKDMNECQRNNGGCQQTCVNTLGSFTCRCDTGYTINVDGQSCDDVDECQRNNGGCQQRCINTPGSFQCGCDTGYRKRGATKSSSCEDIDECQENNGGCDQVCTNTPGSFKCNCTGLLYRLHSNGQSCVAECPSDFRKADSLNSCYWVTNDARSVPEAQQYCENRHPLAKLASVETDDERDYIKGMLSEDRSEMLEGWQGWWTSGVYREGLNQFQWDGGRDIDKHWGFKKRPFEETCVWILQISVYNYTYGNYDCLTRSGHICEINLPN